MGILKKKWWALIVIGAYAALSFALLTRHEPWFDEAQYWLVARDIGIVELFSNFLRYEGTPGLWILILMLPAKLQLPYITLSIISALIAIAGIFLVVFYSPFPIIIRVLYPFTYFIFYQYAVVARSYVLLPLIFSLIAIIYPVRREKIYIFTILLMFLGLVSLHGFLMASGLAAVEGIGALRQWKTMARGEKISYFKSAALFGIFSVINLLILWPPTDSSSLTGFNLDPLNYLRINAQVTSEFTAGYRIPSIALFSVLLWWLWRTGKLLIFLATAVPTLTLFALTWVFPHHTGIIFLVLMFNLWLSFTTYKAGEWKKWPVMIAMTAILITFSFHIYWTVCAFRYDYSEKYSASRDVAEYLKANHLDNQKIAAVGNRTLAILPYFDKNIFANFNAGQKPSYWVWAKRYNTNVWTYEDITHESIHNKVSLATKDEPDIVVATVIGEYDPCNTSLPGYKLTKLFWGRVFWRNKVSDQESFAIFTRETDKNRIITELNK